MTDGLTADVWMPYFGIELHYWGAERVLSRYSDINRICASFIWGSGWTLKRTFKMCQVFPISERAGRYIQKGVIMGIGNLFRNSTSPVGSHVAVFVVLSVVCTDGVFLIEANAFLDNRICRWWHCAIMSYIKYRVGSKKTVLFPSLKKAAGVTSGRRVEWIWFIYSN